jgi:hypothetical protein
MGAKMTGLATGAEPECQDDGPATAQRRRSTTMRTTRTLALAAAVAMAGTFCSFADNGTSQGGAAGGGRARAQRGKGPGSEFRQEQRERAREHREEQKAERQALREELKGKTPNEVAAGIKELAQTQHTENTAFRTEQYNRLVAHVTERLKSSQLPEEARPEILEQIEAFHDELVAHRTSHYESTVELLGTLANDADLTMEELRSSLKEHFKSIRETGEAFHEEHRARRKEFRQGIREEYGRGRGRGQGQGRNRGQGKGNGPGAGTGRGIEEAVPTSTEE